jgi:hypothetical protein
VAAAAAAAALAEAEAEQAAALAEAEAATLAAARAVARQARAAARVIGIRPDANAKRHDGQPAQQPRRTRRRLMLPWRRRRSARQQRRPARLRRAPSRARARASSGSWSGATTGHANELAKAKQRPFFYYSMIDKFFFLMSSISGRLFVGLILLIVSQYRLLMYVIKICKQNLLFISKLLIRLANYSLGKILTLISVRNKHLARNFVKRISLKVLLMNLFQEGAKMLSLLLMCSTFPHCSKKCLCSIARW